jgi:hypothetical protein
VITLRRTTSHDSGRGTITDGISPIWLAFTANLFVAATTFAVHGCTAAGAHAAARNTARLAFLVFLIAVSIPGLTHLIRGLPTEENLTYAYVATHFVHYAVVSVLLVAFESAPLRQAPGKSAAIVLLGFLVVLIIGITARPRPSRFYGAVHGLALYSVFVIFFLIYLRYRVKPLRLLVIPLGLALILRLTSKLLSTRTSRGGSGASA